MPELPEVETTARGIEPHLRDRRIARLVVHEHRLRWRVDPELGRWIHGQQVTGVRRRAKYILRGVEFGGEAQYAFGTFEPDFGSGFVPQVADEQTSKDHNVPIGSLGFRNRFTGWNSLETREFDHIRAKAFMKAQF
jgi:hypothetical protein